MARNAVKDKTARWILEHNLCRPGCLNAVGREKHACECPQCLGVLHAAGANQVIKGSGVLIEALLALREKRGDEVEVAEVDPDDGALIPLAQVQPADAGGAP